MIISIDDHHRIAADAHSWAIQRRRRRRHRKTRELVEKWESFQWFATLEQTVNGLADLMLRTSDAETLDAALKETKRIVATLSQALAPTFIVTAAPLPEGNENAVATPCHIKAAEKKAVGG